MSEGKLEAGARWKEERGLASEGREGQMLFTSSRDVKKEEKEGRIGTASVVWSLRLVPSRGPVTSVPSRLPQVQEAPGGLSPGTHQPQLRCLVARYEVREC